MQTINRSLAVLAFAALAAALFGATLTAHASTSSTFAVSQTAAAVTEVKAARTITVTGNFNGTVNASSVTLTIGTCAITITASPAADSDCSNNTATIATSTNTTAAAIAGAIRSITGFSDTGHGALTVGGSSATASFTTTGTETSATAVTATLSAGTDVTLTTVNTTGIVAVAQAVAFTPGSFSANDDFEIRLNGTDYRVNGSTVQEVVELLSAAVNADGSAVVGCTENDTAVTCTADAVSTAFTYAAFVLEHHGSGGSSHHSGGSGSSSSGNSSNVAGLEAKLTELKAKLLALLAGTPAPANASANAVFNRDLDVGSEGTDVTTLQNWLIGKGYSIPAGATGHFGAQTKAALAAYQAASGITPAVGYFGPKTRAAVKGGN